MMAFTRDGAHDPAMVARRDQYYNVDTEQVKEHRATHLDFSHDPSKDADHWMKGEGAYQLELVKRDFKSSKSTLG